MQQSQEFIDRAKEKGMTPSVHGDWIKWEPPLTVPMIMESMPLNDEIFILLTEEAKGL